VTSARAKGKIKEKEAVNLTTETNNHTEAKEVNADKKSESKKTAATAAKEVTRKTLCENCGDRGKKKKKRLPELPKGRKRESQRLGWWGKGTKETKRGPSRNNYRGFRLGRERIGKNPFSSVKLKHQSLLQPYKE